VPEFTEAELDIGRADKGSVVARLFQHLMDNLDADYPAGVADLLCGRNQSKLHPRLLGRVTVLMLFSGNGDWLQRRPSNGFSPPSPARCTQRR
jgi:hypothetical protein